MCSRCSRISMAPIYCLYAIPVTIWKWRCHVTFRETRSMCAIKGVSVFFHMSGSFYRASILWLLFIFNDFERANHVFNAKTSTFAYAWAQRINQVTYNKSVYIYLAPNFHRLHVQGVTDPVLRNSWQLSYFFRLHSLVSNVNPPAQKSLTRCLS